MANRKIEPKAPRIKPISYGGCMYIETETRELLYSVCGERETANSAIKRLAKDYQSRHTIADERKGSRKR